MTGLHATVILAISADGKIADAVRSPARFGSAKDKAHLEQQVAASDAVLFGNGTLQAYGTTMRVISPELLSNRGNCKGSPHNRCKLSVRDRANLTQTCDFSNNRCLAGC